MALGLPFKRWVNIDPTVGTIDDARVSRPQAVQNWETTLCLQSFGRDPASVRTNAPPPGRNADAWLSYQLPYAGDPDEPASKIQQTLQFYALNHGVLGNAQGYGSVLMNHTGTYFDTNFPVDMSKVATHRGTSPPANTSPYLATAPMPWTATYNCYDSITRRTYLVLFHQDYMWRREDKINGTKYRDRLEVIEYQLDYDDLMDDVNYVFLEGYRELGRWNIEIDLPTEMSMQLQQQGNLVHGKRRSGGFYTARGGRPETASNDDLEEMARQERYAAINDVAVLNGIFYVFFQPSSVIAFTLENGFIADSYFELRCFSLVPDNENYFYPKGVFLDPEKILLHLRLPEIMSIFLWPSREPDFSDPTLLKQSLGVNNQGFDGFSWSRQTSDTRIAMARPERDGDSGEMSPVLIFPAMDGQIISRIFFMYGTRRTIDVQPGHFPSALNRWILSSYGFRRGTYGSESRSFPRRGEVKFGDYEAVERVYEHADSERVALLGRIAPWNTHNWCHPGIYPGNFRDYTYPASTSWKGQPYTGGPYYHKASRINIPFRVRLVEEEVTLDRQIREEVTTSGADVSRTAVSIRGEYLAEADAQVFNLEDAFSFPIEGQEDISFFYGGYKYSILEGKRTSRVRWRLKMKVTIE